MVEGDDQPGTGVIVYDPASSVVVERLDFVEVDRFTELVLIDSTRTLVANKSGLIVTYTLPPQYFLLAKCCDRDL